MPVMIRRALGFAVLALSTTLALPLAHAQEARPDSEPPAPAASEAGEAPEPAPPLALTLPTPAEVPEAVSEAHGAQRPRSSSWHQGPSGRRRAWRLAAVASAGALYLASETVLKDGLTADQCRWCRPPSLDESVRDSLVWSDRGQARSLSNLTGYVAAPLVAVGLTAIIGASRDSEDTRFARILDDTLPVLEAVAYSQLLVQTVKFSVARQRPRVRFAEGPVTPGNDDNVSFFSGHSALTFALATSAGIIAQRRDSSLAPVIWTLGYGLAGSTAFLRIAADEHYFTDVLAGSAFGAAAGYLAPLLLDRASSRQLAVLPAPGGLTLVGTL